MARWIAADKVLDPAHHVGAQLTPEIRSSPLNKQASVSDTQSAPTLTKSGAAMAARDEEHFADGVARWPAPGRAPVLGLEDVAVITSSASHRPRLHNTLKSFDDSGVKSHRSQIEVTSSMDSAALEEQAANVITKKAGIKSSVPKVPTKSNRANGQILLHPAKHIRTSNGGEEHIEVSGSAALEQQGSQDKGDDRLPGSIAMWPAPGLAPSLALEDSTVVVSPKKVSELESLHQPASMLEVPAEVTSIDVALPQKVDAADDAAEGVHHAHTFPKAHVPVKPHSKFVPTKDDNKAIEGIKLEGQSSSSHINLHQEKQAASQEAQPTAPKLMRRA